MQNLLTLLHNTCIISIANRTVVIMIRHHATGSDFLNFNWNECADSSRLPVKETFKSLFFLIVTHQTMSSVLPRFHQLQLQWYCLEQCHRENENVILYVTFNGESQQKKLGQTETLVSRIIED